MSEMIRPGLARRLSRDIAGEVLFDRSSRGRYATDASIYQIMPAGVVVAKGADDVAAALDAAREEGVALTMRGGGTSQCGQTVNSGLIVDTSKHMNRLIELDVAGRRALVEPGIVLDDLNRLLKPHGLWFPVDVSTASRARSTQRRRWVRSAEAGSVITVLRGTASLISRASVVRGVLSLQLRSKR